MRINPSGNDCSSFRYRFYTHHIYEIFNEALLLPINKMLSTYYWFLEISTWFLLFRVLLCFRMVDYNYILSGLLKTLWRTDAIWRHGAGSTLAQVMAWCLIATSWTNVDSSSVKSNGIQSTAIRQEISKPSITKIMFKIGYLKCRSYPPQSNELIKLTNIPDCLTASETAQGLLLLTLIPAWICD